MEREPTATMNLERLREVRVSMGFTQDELAEKVGVQVLQINRWEKGKNSPTADYLVKLAEVLAVSTDYLLGLSDDPTPPELSVLSPGERALLSAYRNADYKRAMKIISDKW